MRRPRGPGGRFLTAEEIAAQKIQQEIDAAGPSGSASIDGDGEDDDDAMGDSTKDVDMTVDSPIEPSKPPSAPTQVQIQSQQPDKQREIRPPPALVSGQPLLQPRPQLAGPTLQPQFQPPPQAQQQASMVPQQQPTPQPKPQPSPILQAPPPMQSPPPPTFNLHLGGHSTTPVSLMNLGYPHPMSHPATPVPVSHNSTPDALNPLEHVPPEAYSCPQPLPHDHSHTMTTAAGHPHPQPGAHTHSHAGQPGKAAHMPPSHPVQTAGPSTSIALRAPYAAMQMHHVPHPHAHARHHASLINRSERRYSAGPEHNVLNISAEGIKGDIQRRGGDIMRFAAPSHSSNSK